MKRKKTAFERLLIARDRSRPKITDYTAGLFDDFLELSGDRLGGEDAAIYGGIGDFGGRTVTVIGHRKGSSLEENLRCNFGMAGPEGYRKSLRLMKQAEKFHRPVITLIDTPGAYPGMEAEEHGISAAIAENIAQMSRLRTPIIAIVTGEGSSGGALALAVADQVWMLENAVYSILSPEGFASILWKDASRSREAADVMQMTAEELLSAGLIDKVISEPDDGIQCDPNRGFDCIRKELRKELRQLDEIPMEQLLEMRYQKFRRFEGEKRPVRSSRPKAEQ